MLTVNLRADPGDATLFAYIAVSGANYVLVENNLCFHRYSSKLSSSENLGIEYAYCREEHSFNNRLPSSVLIIPYDLKQGPSQRELVIFIESQLRDALDEAFLS